MSNELTTLDNSINKALAALNVDIDALATSVEESQAAVQHAQAELPGFMNFAKFMKAGEEGEISPWQYGREDEERQIRPDSEWLVDFNSIEWGWSGYKKTNGATGDLIKGQKPDQFLSSCFGTFPKQNPEFPWATSTTFRFRAMCLKEGAGDPEEAVEAKGDAIEVTVHQGMASGFMELCNAVRARIGAYNRAKAAGNTAQMQELLSTMYPVVQLQFQTGVKTKYGKNNKPILKQLGWGSPIVSLDAPEAAGPETPKADLADAIDAAQEATPPTAPKGKRSRTK